MSLDHLNRRLKELRVDAAEICGVMNIDPTREVLVGIAYADINVANKKVEEGDDPPPAKPI